MNTNQAKTLYRVKGNRFLFIVKNVWNTIWFAIGTTLSVGLGTFLTAGISGMIWNSGKMNMGMIYLGEFLIPTIIIIRIIYIVLIRKNQFYTITERGVSSEGGVLTRFNQTLRMDQIQSVSYTQTLIQQILGCGNIVVSSAATHRAGLVLFNIDNVKEVYAAIEKYR